MSRTILLAHSPLSSLVYPMITHSPPVASNLPIKTLVAGNSQQHSYITTHITHTHTLTYPVPLSSRINGNFKMSCLEICSTPDLVGWGPCLEMRRVARVRTISHLALEFNFFSSMHTWVSWHQWEGITALESLLLEDSSPADTTARGRGTLSSYCRGACRRRGGRRGNWSRTHLLTVELHIYKWNSDTIIIFSTQ